MKATTTKSAMLGAALACVAALLLSVVIRSVPRYYERRRREESQALDELVALRDWKGVLRLADSVREQYVGGDISAIDWLHNYFDVEVQHGYRGQRDEDTALWGYRNLLDNLSELRDPQGLMWSIHGILCARGQSAEALDIWRSTEPPSPEGGAPGWQVSKLSGKADCLWRLGEHEEVIRVSHELRRTIQAGPPQPVEAYWPGFDATGTFSREWIVAYSLVLEARSLLALGRTEISLQCADAAGRKAEGALLGWAHIVAAEAHAARGERARAARSASLAREALDESLLNQDSRSRTWAERATKRLLRQAILLEWKYGGGIPPYASDPGIDGVPQSTDLGTPHVQF